MADKENESPTNVLQHKLRASARLLSPGSALKSDRVALRRSVGFGKPLSPGQAKQIVLRALGPSPSREALCGFVAGLSKDERRLLIGDSRDATPKTPGALCSARRDRVPSQAICECESCYV